MKKLSTAILISISMIITGCGDDEQKKQNQITQQPNQTQQQVDAYGNPIQPQYQQQMMQQQYQQPVATQPAQPIIINNTSPAPQSQVSHDNSATSALVGMAAGAAMGAVAANMMNDDSPRERVVEKHYVNMPSNPSYSQSTNVPQQNTPVQQAVAAQPPATQTKTEKNAMDMNKLSESAKQQFNTGANNTKAIPVTTQKPSGMDMSKFSSGNTTKISNQQIQTPVAKPTSMNMNKLSAVPQRSSSIGSALAKPVGKR